MASYSKRMVNLLIVMYALTLLLSVATESHTHVQYTQTDTIRQTDGPMVPMVRLVPIEKHPIRMVLLVHMHLIKGT